MSMIYRSGIAINVSSADQTLPKACQAIAIGTAGTVTVDFAFIKQAKAYISAVNGSGAITALTIIDPGFGYVAAPSLSIINTSGSGAVITPLITNGVVTGFTISSGGSGYSATTPDIQSSVVVFSGGLGTGTQLTVPQGVVPISVSKIYHTGTSASNIVALYI